MRNVDIISNTDFRCQVLFVAFIEDIDLIQLQRRQVFVVLEGFGMFLGRAVQQFYYNQWIKSGLASQREIDFAAPGLCGVMLHQFIAEGLQIPRRTGFY